VFNVKLVFIALALVCYAQLRRRAFVNPPSTERRSGATAKAFAIASLVLWTGATSLDA
jgi:hypothetical protein